MNTITKLFFTILVTFFILVGFLHPVSAFTQDLGRHLLLGKMIIETHSVPNTNLFSYTYPDFAFVNHHWLSEVVFYVLFTLGGVNLLLGVTILLAGMGFLIVFLYALKKGAHILPTSLLALLYLRVYFERTDVRPETFGFLFLALFVVILYEYKEKMTNWIYLLIPLSFLWVQLHISFSIGLGIFGLFIIDEIISHRKNLNTIQTKKLIGTFLLSLIICLINPNGLTGLLYPLHIFQNYGYTIEENQTIFFLDSLFFKPTIMYFKIAVLCVFTSLFLAFPKLKIIDWLLLAVFTFLAVSAVRNFPLFVLATFIPASLALTYGLRMFLSFFTIPQALKTYLLLGVGTLIVCCFAWNANSYIKQRPLGVGEVTGAKAAADFFIKQDIKGPIFNNFDIGSYLEYRLYPREKTFIDGRPEAYPASFFKEVYIPMQENPEIFKQIEENYSFNSIFFTHTDMTPWGQSFITTITKDPSWKMVYLDEMVIILVKNTSLNAAITSSYAHPAESFPVSLEKKSTNSLLQLANFFITIQLPNRAKESIEKVLEQDPSNCSALGFILTQVSPDSPVGQLYQSRYKSSCQ